MKPILIVGAGPVGMTMASELVRYGVPVRIIDKSVQRTDKSKALVLWSRTLELLDRGGESAVFVNAGYKAEAINIITADKVIAHVSMKNVNSPYPYGLVIPQSETERLLENRLGDQGVSVERQVELISLKNSIDKVEAILRHADGHEEAVSADWLVGCDGAHSAVRHGIGRRFTGETNSSDWMLADIHLTGYPYPDSEVSVYWHRDGAFVIFPISPGRYRVIADLPHSGADYPPTPTLEQVQAIMYHRGPKGAKAFDPIWLAGFRINGRKVASYRWGRVFLAGDAAHVHSSAGGQGMNTGMQDAFNLAWKMALVVHGTCVEHLLESYSPERSSVGDEVLKTAGRLTTIGTLRNPVAQAVRNIVARAILGFGFVQHQFADNMTEVSIGYLNSPLNGPSLKGVGPYSGERVVPVADQMPVGSGGRPLFVLFAAKSTDSVDLARRFKGLLDSDIRSPIHDDGIWLVRPDGYVACSSTDTNVIASYLDDIIRPQTIKQRMGSSVKDSSGLPNGAK